VQYWQPMHASALCRTIPVAGSFVYASTGQPLKHVGSRQWLHPIERYERDVCGYHPPSISPTRRQLIAAGFPFCSLQATTQHWQPMHLPMSKWKRYCSPGPGARGGKRVTGATVAAFVVWDSGVGAIVNRNLTPSVAARFTSGSDADDTGTVVQDEQASCRLRLVISACQLEENGGSKRPITTLVFESSSSPTALYKSGWFQMVAFDILVGLDGVRSTQLSGPVVRHRPKTAIIF